MEKIVFLDLDGVVVPFGSYSDVDLGLVLSTPHAHVDLMVSKTPKMPVRQLSELAAEAEARFVLISSWRKAFPSSFNKAYLEGIGLFDLFHEAWEAEWKLSSHKGHDIGLWLADHKHVRLSDCLVLDDDDLELGERFGFRGPKLLRHLRPAPQIGFTAHDRAKALKLLNGADGAELDDAGCLAQ
jgi:hypothetical protein